MKKLLSALLALFIVFSFFACKKMKSLKSPPPVSSTFEADANIKFKDVAISCHINQKSFERSEILLTKPKELDGLKIIKTEDECNLRFKNMNFNLDMSKFPKASFAQIMLKCYASLINTENLDITKKDNIYIYEGNIEDGNFIIHQNSKTGNIEKIEVPKVKLIVEFTNIKK